MLIAFYSYYLIDILFNWIYFISYIRNIHITWYTLHRSHLSLDAQLYLSCKYLTTYLKLFLYVHNQNISLWHQHSNSKLNALPPETLSTTTTTAVKQQYQEEKKSLQQQTRTATGDNIATIVSTIMNNIHMLSKCFELTNVCVSCLFACFQLLIHVLLTLAWIQEHVI